MEQTPWSQVQKEEEKRTEIKKAFGVVCLCRAWFAA
jgi:hypothetical protein